MTFAHLPGVHLAAGKFGIEVRTPAAMLKLIGEII
jgi:hypothetical protein